MVMRVGGCRWMGLVSVWRMTVALWALKKRSPSFTSASDTSIFLIIVDIMYIAPLRGGGDSMGEVGEFRFTSRELMKNTLLPVIVCRSLRGSLWPSGHGVSWWYWGAWRHN